MRSCVTSGGVIYSCLLLSLPAAAAELLVSGTGEMLLNSSSAIPDWQRPWYDGGTGQLAHHQDGVQLGPQYLSTQLLTETAWSAQLNAQWHSAPEAGLSITEAWLNWAPLPQSGYRWRARLGLFYPAFSAENSDIAWTSPYSSSFSAINSWFAEEVRVRAVELSLSRPGRFFRQPYSWTLVGGVFQGNDPAGTVLAWRGFAIHNLQTGQGERVNFASYPSLNSGVLQLQPAWVEPTRELDHNNGFYTGLHWQYQQHSRFKLYYYDNQGDPLVFSHGQYAWRTRFVSAAWQQAVTPSISVLAQWLAGDTLMGPAVVDVSFDAWFLLAHWRQDTLSASLRYDRFRTLDRDSTPADNNNGNGDAWTLALSYQLNPVWQLSLEHIRFNSVQYNRMQWQWPVNERQANTQLILRWHWQ
ncbi:hypothetical protein [Rheinheimera maricola]|uniref:Porin n=1 Tax=Rheinheimera maricola TaxID=2793282 RepID=A0ABS7X759_9GAMM|nr:hypothetical protein [Rheinheimera maricola]MBZ9611377.1 hypothetical protein [Rheinheimera maricola]